MLSLRPNFPPYNNNDSVCHCLGIKRGELAPLVMGDSTLNDLIICSGAGSVCTGCHPLLREMLGETIWLSVELSNIRTLSAQTKSYRFIAKESAFTPAKAGQHILLQAYIDGVWQLRRYTLTTPAAETSYREITVKNKLNGCVSKRLHALPDNEMRIRISQPLGQVTPDLTSSKPLICFVAGIGITPVIAFIRSITRHVEYVRPLVIDYSVLTQDQLLFGDELARISNIQQPFNVTLRFTLETGEIQPEDVRRLLINPTEVECYVCGSEAFSISITQQIKAAGVKPEAIHIERFTAPESTSVNPSKRYFYLGLGLLLLFVMQDVFVLKMARLEQWQAQETFKIYSGLLVVSYLLAQFILPYNRLCQMPHVVASSYQRHQWQGAVAPLFFFIHSTSIGVGYLLLLSSVYFANVLVGLFNHERIKNPIKRTQFFKGWLPLHIVLALLLLSLVGFHIYIVASY